MDSSDRYKVSEQDAAVWTLIYKIVKAAQHGDPFEASRRVAELIAPILADAEKWRRVINTLEVCQDCPLRYRCVDGCVVEELVDALEGKEVK